MISTATAAYLVLFITVAVSFVFAALLLGRFLRANAPTRQKLETYECGEPAIGPSWVKFDLRFYTVALVFLIFDVEVAFFFPWAAVFGTSTRLIVPEQTVAVAQVGSTEAEQANQAIRKGLSTLGVPSHAATLSPMASSTSQAESRSFGAEKNSMQSLALVAMAEIGLFFAILMVGFAYVWYRGDLDWVRASMPPPRK
jgi:NADH-quinone oxidoreductase subunit A